MVAQHIGILPLSVLVHTQAHATSHLLPLLGLVVGVLQSAYLEDVWVVPAFLQGGVRKDETYRFVQRQQAFLVLHDEVKGTFLVLAFFPLRVNHLSLLVHREITLVHFLRGIARV